MNHYWENAKIHIETKIENCCLYLDLNNLWVSYDELMKREDHQEFLKDCYWFKPVKTKKYMDLKEFIQQSKKEIFEEIATSYILTR